MMKKFFAMVFAALALCACGGNKDNPETPGGGSGGNGSGTSQTDISGCWELVSVTTKVGIGGLPVSVYLDFTTSGGFTLYQQIGDGRYTKFTGTYVLSSDNKLSGKYDGGANWGPYSAEISAKTIKLTTPGNKEVDTYEKVKAIPASVLGNVY
jgi:hypothetical protein